QEAGLKFVYEGNVPGEGGENTACPACGKSVIERIGFRLGQVNLRQGACGHCGAPVAGCWND
ncbi:MAG: radical SAM protein, partial [Desulfuromonadales bacterium]|nr:radical SAM protein [Desulfuromonadales bacterium]